MVTKANRYEGVDGLKTYAILGIALNKPRFPFYDGQRVWNVLWLLPENH